MTNKVTEIKLLIENKQINTALKALKNFVMELPLDFSSIKFEFNNIIDSYEQYKNYVTAEEDIFDLNNDIFVLLLKRINALVQKCEVQFSKNDESIGQASTDSIRKDNNSSETKQNDLQTISTIEKIKNLVENAKLDKAISILLIEAKKSHPELFLEISSFKTQLKETHKQSMLGLITFADENKLKTKINLKILKLAEEVWNLKL